MSNVIYRGTTPGVRCTVDTDLTGFDIYFSIGPKARKPWFTVTGDNMIVEKSGINTVIEFGLTQEQTLSMRAGNAFAQLRAVKGEAVASTWADVVVKDIIKDGVITWER